jgi:hypothetical protein
MILKQVGWDSLDEDARRLDFLNTELQNDLRDLSEHHAAQTENISSIHHSPPQSK